MEITPLPPTTKGPGAMFTGDVWFDVLAAPPEPQGPDTEWADEVTDEQYARRSA